MAIYSIYNIGMKLQLLDEYPSIFPAGVSHPPPPSSPLILFPGQFDSDRPYHLVGFGFGGAVATFYASHFSSPSLRSLILLNSFSYVDAHLAGVLHDCMNIFGCAPDSRPDLPVYFHARFLFSPAYLGQVCSSRSAPPVTSRAKAGKMRGCFQGQGRTPLFLEASHNPRSSPTRIIGSV